jgi:hypothetical protein
MIAVSAKHLRRIRQLFALMGSNAAGERENARVLLGELLEKLRLTWNDLPSLLAPPEPAAAPADGGSASALADDDDLDAQMVCRALEVVHYSVRSFIDVKPYEHIAIVLWALHTFVPDKFLVSPRLALLSPVPGCGKTTVLSLLELLTARPLRCDNISCSILSAPSAAWLSVGRRRRQCRPGKQSRVSSRAEFGASPRWLSGAWRGA